MRKDSATVRKILASNPENPDSLQKYPAPLPLRKEPFMSVGTTRRMKIVLVVVLVLVVGR